jgi:hypothetical protein
MKIPGFSAERSLDSDWRVHWIMSDVNHHSNRREVMPAMLYIRCWEDEYRKQSVCKLVDMEPIRQCYFFLRKIFQGSC